MAAQQKQQTHIGLLWKLRRTAAGYTQQEVSTHCGISMVRYRAIEHGHDDPSDLDRRLIEQFLPPLPEFDSQPRDQVTTELVSP
jgi:transcriptional regulator with XRE-family HTH domain